MLPRIARLHAYRCAIKMNEVYALFGILLRNQSVRWNLCKVWVGEERFPIYKGQLLGFHHSVYALSGIAAESSQIEMLDQVQFLQQHVAARIGWRFVDGVVAIARANGLLPAALTSDEIGFGQQPPLLFAEPD